MKKTLLAVVLIFLLLCPSGYAATAQETSLRVSVTDFVYSGFTAGDVLTVSATLQQIFEGSQNYLFLVVVTKNGGYIDSDYQSGELVNGAPQDVSATVTLPSDLTGVRVETYVWESLFSGIALTPQAEWKYGAAPSADNKLLAMYVDGKELAVADTMTVSCSGMVNTPNIAPVAADSGAKVTLGQLTKLPAEAALAVDRYQMPITVTAENSAEKVYQLIFELPKGNITDAYQLTDTAGEKKEIKKAEIMNPTYAEGKSPEEVGSFKDAVIKNATKIYNDRDIYWLLKVPEFFLDKTLLQVSFTVIYSSQLHHNSAYGKEKTGFFTIDRTADVYVFGAHEGTDWLKMQGYQLADSNYGIERTTGNNLTNKETTIPYKKRFIVEEGMTETVWLGGATSADGVWDDYFIIVDFDINPASVCEVENIHIDGIGDLNLQKGKYEYELMTSGVTEPKITCDVVGFGASTEYSYSADGKTATIVISSGDGSNTLTYTVNLMTLEDSIKEILVDGKVIEGFTPDQLTYTVPMKYGQEDPPQISCSALPGVDVNIEQATLDNLTATVMVSNSKNPSEQIVYTVIFNLTSVENTVTPSIAYIGSSKDAAQIVDSTSAFRVQASYFQNMNIQNFLRIDLSSMADADTEKKFVLRLRGRVPSVYDLKLRAFKVPSSFVWATEAANEDRMSGNTVATDDYNNYVKGKTPFYEVTVNNIADDWIELDITDAIAEGFKSGTGYAYVMLSSDDSLTTSTSKYRTFTYYITGDNAPQITYFSKSAPAPESAETTLQLYNGFVAKGWSTMINSKNPNDTEDYYWYQADQKNKNEHGFGIAVYTTSEDATTTASSNTLYRAPVLMQLDFSRLDNIDLSKAVYLNLYYNRDDIYSGNGLAIFDATGLIDWDNSTAATTDDPTTANLRAGLWTATTNSEKQIATATSDNYVLGAYADGVFVPSGATHSMANESGCFKVNITDFVKSCLEASTPVTNPTIAIHRTGSAGVLRFNYNSAAASFVTYSAFAE